MHGDGENIKFYVNVHCDVNIQWRPTSTVVGSKCSEVEWSGMEVLVTAGCLSLLEDTQII